MSWVIRRLPRALSVLRKASADEACCSKYLHSLCKPHTNKPSSSLFTRPLLFQLRVRFSTAAEETLWNEKHANDGPVVAADDDGAESSFIPVKAYLLGTGVDLKGIQVECSLDGSPFEAVPPNSRSANYVIFKSIDEFHNYNPVAKFGAESKDEKWSDNHYMVVFQYGSVVFFNFKDQEELEQKCIQIVRKFASGLLTEIRKDDYGILEKPSLDKWMKDGSDYIVLKRFDIDCIRTIGSVLGQSIALDHFVRQVDVMVAEFTDLNRGMEKTGTFTMKRKKLFQLVGKANSNLADVILKLGLFERSDVAWKNARYAQIWEYLRDEYELTQRFGSLDYKLKFVEHNVRYFLEILQNRKSDFLEWLIIILISAEIMIGLYEIAHNTGMAS